MAVGALSSAALPSALVPIRLPSTCAPVPPCTNTCAALPPAMTLRSAAALPPRIAPLAPCSVIANGAPFAASSAPSALVPMKLPATFTFATPSMAIAGTAKFCTTSPRTCEPALPAAKRSSGVVPLTVVAST